MPIRPSFAVSPIATVSNAFAAGKREQRRYLDQLQLNVAQMQQRERLARMQMAGNMYQQQQGQAGAMQRMQYGAQMDAMNAQAASRARNQQMAQQFSNQKEMLGLGQQNRLEAAQQGQQLDITTAADKARAKLENTLGQFPDEALSKQGQEYRAGLMEDMKRFEEDTLPTATAEDRLYWVNEMQGRAEALKIPRFKKPPEESIDDIFNRESIKQDDGTTWTRDPNGKWTQHLPQKDTSSGDETTMVDPSTGSKWVRTPDNKWQLTLDMEKLESELWKSMMDDPESYMGFPLDEQNNEIKEQWTGVRNEDGSLEMESMPKVFRQDLFEKAYRGNLQMRKDAISQQGAMAAEEEKQKQQEMQQQQAQKQQEMQQQQAQKQQEMQQQQAQQQQEMQQQQAQQQQGANPPGQQPGQGGPPQQPPGMAPQAGGQQQQVPPGMRQPPQQQPPAMPPAAGGDGAVAPGMAPPQGPEQDLVYRPDPNNPPAPAPPLTWDGGPVEAVPLQQQVRKQQKAANKQNIEVARAKLSQGPIGLKAISVIDRLLQAHPGQPLSAYSKADRKAYEEATATIKALMGGSPARGEF